jgi:hypothetical protein
MSAAETVWRFALAMFAADPQAVLAKTERAWLVARVQDPALFPAQDRAAWEPRLLAYADARNPALGVSLRQTLGLTPRQADPQGSALTLMAQYPGNAAREEAAVLAETTKTSAPNPETKGTLL